ncbi:unnamed protein product [Phytophthora fragariaefolia]|uniref:Unnamed protein product n=1 Tax=Phytophthora fragariaefolia TaxID=1490495 RepID=A0A9W6TKH4_9STRA|nr:unnamed protein product [Phytophthora fragariaefolia]
MTGSESTDGACAKERGARVELKGLPPEEQSSLKEVERTARRRNAARRRAAREEKESTVAQDQPDSEPAIQEAHQAKLDAGTRDGSVEEPPKGSEKDSVSESLELSNSDASAPASAGDAVKVELTIKDESPLPAVEEESVPANSNDALQLRSELASPRLIQEDTQRPSPEVPETSVTRAYVADQVRLWERVTLEFVASPTVEYSWASSVPDFQPRWAAVMATSEYVASRMSMANPNDAWISEWNLVRLGPSTAVDVTGVMVPPSSLSPRECAALTKTLFFDAGFRFRNLIPGWFQARTSQVGSSFARAVTQDLQQLLAVELLEWRDLASGASSRIVPALSVQSPGDDVKFEESGMEVAMADYEAWSLGRECLHRMRMAGVRPTRPVLPSGSLSPSAPNHESSLFGTTIANSDESNFSGVLVSRSSGKYSSSSSSMWSFGGAPAGAHMHYADATGMVMTVPGATFQDASPVGVQVTETILPVSPVLVDQDDVVMSDQHSDWTPVEDVP